MFDWGFAWQLAGVGFGMVFLILTILAIILWIVSKAVRRIETKIGEKQNP